MVLYCKLLTIGKQLPTFPNMARGLNHQPQRWEVCVLPLHPPPKKKKKMSKTTADKNSIPTEPLIGHGKIKITLCIKSCVLSSYHDITSSEH